MNVTSLLLDTVGRAGDPTARGRVQPTVDILRGGWDAAAFFAAFTGLARRLGQQEVRLAPEDLDRLQAAGVTTAPARWALDELGRACLLSAAAEALPPGDLPGFVEDCYQHGDTRERQAVLRSLGLLPGPERFVPLAVEACRSSVQPLFEAVACENPYPTTYFPELNFNQMVLKALFVGVPLARIEGLGGRITGDLVRMSTDYASERRAAGRTVPADIAVITGGQERS